MERIWLVVGTLKTRGSFFTQTWPFSASRVTTASLRSLPMSWAATSGVTL